MKKSVRLAVAMAAAALLLTACGGTSQSTSKVAESKSTAPTTLNIKGKTLTGTQERNGQKVTYTIHFYSGGQFVRVIEHTGADLFQRQIESGDYKRKGTQATLEVRHYTVSQYASASDQKADRPNSYDSYAYDSAKANESAIFMATKAEIKAKSLYDLPSKTTLVPTNKPLARYTTLQAAAKTRFAATTALDGKDFASPGGEGIDSRVAFKGNRFIWKYIHAANGVWRMASMTGHYILAGTTLTCTVDAESPTYLASNMSQILGNYYNSKSTTKLINVSTFTVHYANDALTPLNATPMTWEGTMANVTGQANTFTYDSLSAYSPDKIDGVLKQGQPPMPEDDDASASATDADAETTTKKTVKDIWGC